jgi:hAT family C-terminal dimerisation region
VQIKNTTGYAKTAAYIKGTCTDFLAELKARCPNTSVAGFVMDSAAANRSAMSMLDEDGSVRPMVNLQCAAHMLSLLMKDLCKRFDWVEDVFSKVLFISASFNGSEQFKSMLKAQCIHEGVAYSGIVTHCDTRFASKYLVALSVDRHLKALLSVAGSAAFLELLRSENEIAAKLHNILLGQYCDPGGLVKRLPVLKMLFDPIKKCLTQVEADRSNLSRMRALVRELEAHANSFTQCHEDLCRGVIRKKGQGDKTVTLVTTFDDRLRTFYYKPSMSAAFLLDPVNFRLSHESEIRLPFEALTREEEDAAVADMTRLAGGNSDALECELKNMKLFGITGLSSLNMKVVRECMLISEEIMPDGSSRRSSAPTPNRLMCWTEILQPEFPTLAKVASIYLSMHSTSCAAERNLSVFGRLYDKSRGKLQLKRAEKVVFLAVNERIETGCMDTSKEEVLFNDSDIEDDDVEEDAAIDRMADLLETGVQDEPAADVDDTEINLGKTNPVL